MDAAGRPGEHFFQESLSAICRSWQYNDDRPRFCSTNYLKEHSMWRLCLPLAFTALLLGSSTAYGGGAYVDPAALGQQARAKVTGEELTITRTQSLMVQETHLRTEQRAKTVEVDGEIREETFTVTVPVTVAKCVPTTQQQKIPIDRAQVFDMQGKRVAAEKIAEALAEERTILLAARKLPGYYLSIYKPDTLLVVVAPQGLFQPSLPIAAPQPGPRVDPQPAAPVPVEAPQPEPPRTLPAPAVTTPPAPPDRAAPGVAVAAAPIAAVPAAEPQVSIARILQDKLALRQYVKSVTSETGSREVEADGVKKLAPFSIEVESITDVERKYPQGVLKIYRADKKPLADDEIAKLKETERCVLVSSDGKEVDAGYLKIVRPDTLIVVAPVTPSLLPPAPIPSPAAPLPVATPTAPK
jgi:hypothetical protein